MATFDYEAYSYYLKLANKHLDKTFSRLMHILYKNVPRHITKLTMQGLFNANFKVNDEGIVRVFNRFKHRTEYILIDDFLQLELPDLCVYIFDQEAIDEINILLEKGQAKTKEAEK